MTIDEIYRKKEISVRSYHVCKYNELNSISDLKKYYYKNKSFEKLHNCGRKSNKELIEIFNKYPDEYFENKKIEVKEENPLKSIISNLTRVQREVINSFIFVNTNSLSVRSKNAISLHLKNNLKVKNFVEKILLSESFNVQNIKNVGAKCVPEIEIYISIIKDFIFEVNQTRDEKYLIALKNKFLMQRTFDIPLVPNKILESESIFQITEFLLNQNAFFDESQTNIVKRALKLFNNQKELTLDEIAEQVNLSRERVRQIRKLCLEDLFNKLLFISNFNDDLFQKFSIDVESMYIDINTDILNKINQSNNTNFSREFITFILSAYLKDSFSIVGNYEDVLQPKYFNSRNRHNWNNFYLVEKELFLEFDFTSFTNDISNRVSDRIEESYSFNFKSYLSKFLSNNNINFLDLLFPICEKIINEEFEIYLDLEENINFKRNTTRQAHEYAFEALEHLGKPSKVKEIFEKVIELHPNYDTEEVKIRVSMKRKNGFVPIGRKSVFGLKKWERELENFKGGTIKDVVIDFLQNKSEPQHIEEILRFLSSYRKDKTAKNVLTNIKLDPSSRFLILNQNFIGLKSKEKQYSSKYFNLPVQLGKKIKKLFNAGYSTFDIETSIQNTYKLTCKEVKCIFFHLGIDNQKDWPEKLNKSNQLSLENFPLKLKRTINIGKYQLSDLIDFIRENHKMPDSRDPNERNLYKFYYRNKQNLEKQKLDEEEIILKGLIEEYGSTKGVVKYQLSDLIDFIRENHKMPDSRDPNERNLYQFYYRARKLYQEFKLTENEIYNFKEVSKLIKKIKDENKRN